MDAKLCIVATIVATIAALLPSAARAQSGASTLELYDFGVRAEHFELPGRLDEVSGLAITPDGRLFAHDDERATIHELEPSTGDVGKRFSLGDPPVRGDFEGIAIVGERFFLVTSRGLLYEFREMADRNEAPYRVTDTELGAICEIEGLDHDPIEDALLFACKVAAPDRGTIVVHRIPLDPGRTRPPPLEVPRSQLLGRGLDDAFQPSAVTVGPAGTLLVLSATAEALIEVDRSGRLVAGVQFSNGAHRQPEGLAIGPDGTLHIADEERGRDARVTSYPRSLAGAGDR